MKEQIWKAVAWAGGYKEDGIPPELVGFIEELDHRIRDANDDCNHPGLHSTQIIALVVLLWKLDILNEKVILERTQ